MNLTLILWLSDQVSRSRKPEKQEILYYNVMDFSTKENPIPRKILWLDTAAGGFTGLVGIVFYDFWVTVLGLPKVLVLIISGVSLVYALGAFMLARKENLSDNQVKALVYANLLAGVVGIVLIFFYFESATVFGKIFLVLQVFAISGLAYFESKYLNKSQIPSQ